MRMATLGSLVSKTTLSPTDYNVSYDATYDVTNATEHFDFACAAVTQEKGVLDSHKAFIFLSMVFVVAGMVGNCLSLVVFASPSMRHVSSNVYLWVLSVSDTCYLLTVFLIKVLPTLRCIYYPASSFDFSNYNSSACILLQFCVDLFSDYSTCLILAFTVERFLACHYVVVFRDVCNVSRARILCVLLFILIVTFIMPYHILFIGLYEEYNVCTVLVPQEKKFTIMYLTEALIFRIVPVFCIACLNCSIILKLSELKEQRSRRRSSCVLNQNQNNRMSRLAKERNIQVTVLLLLVSSSYVILYFPVLIHFLVWSLHRAGVITVADSTLIITKNYSAVLYILGFTINFYLYTLSGRIFRDQLSSILCGTSKKIYHEINNLIAVDETTGNGTHLNNVTVTMNSRV